VDGPQHTSGPAPSAVASTTVDASDPSVTALGGRVRRGLILGLVNNGLVRLVTMGTGLVLARLLEPQDYGIFAAALTMLMALLSFNELGVSVALVKDPRPPARLAPTIATISLGSSACFFVIALVAAPWLARAFGSPEGTSIFRLLAIGVLFDGVASVPVALLTREIQQGRRLIASVGGLVVNCSLAISLAAAGFGVYSLVWSYLGGSFVTAVLSFFLASHRFRPGWNREIARELVRFGLPLAASSLLFFGTLNIDYLIVGRVLGSVSLGYYLLAFNLSSWPTSLISAAVRPVALAGFSHITFDRAYLRATFERSLMQLLLVAAPMAVMMGVLAEPLVMTLYGSRWLPAADALRWLAVLGGARVIHELIYDLLIACDAPRVTARVQAVWLAALAPGLWIGAEIGGIGGVALAHAVIVTVVVGPAYALGLRGRGLFGRSTLRAFLVPALATAAVAAMTLLGRHLGGSEVVRLVVGGAMGGATALVALVLGFRTAAAPARDTPDPDQRMSAVQHP
jgi:PST family polysaccharide transporter